MSSQQRIAKSLPILLLLLCLTLLTGCGSDSPAPTVIEFWAMGREGEVVQQLLPAFEQRHPGIRVRVQQIPWSAAHEKLLTAYVGNSMPDVFQLGNTWLPEFVALRAVAPLDSRLAGSTVIAPDDYFPGIWATNALAGRHYGIPWYVDTRLLFYRKDLLAQAGYAEPPHDWDGWVTAMQHVRQQAGGQNYAILLPINEWQAPIILALQQGAGLLRDNGQYGDFQSPPFRAAFTFYLDLFHQQLAPALGETQVANLYQEFANGYFAFYLTGPWNIGEFERRLPAALKGRWGTAPLPAPTGPYPGVSLAGGASLAIFQGSPHQEAAWKLLEYLSEPAQQIAFYRLTGDLPSRKSAWQQAALIEDPYARAFWMQLQRVMALPQIPEWERIASLIGRYSEAALRGDLSAEAALAALNGDVDRLLEKRRWLLRRAQQ